MCEVLESYRKSGLEEGREVTLIDNLMSIMESLNMTFESAAQVLKVPEESYEHLKSVIASKQ